MALAPGRVAGAVASLVIPLALAMLLSAAKMLDTTPWIAVGSASTNVAGRVLPANTTLSRDWMAAAKED